MLDQKKFLSKIYEYVTFTTLIFYPNFLGILFNRITKLSYCEYILQLFSKYLFVSNLLLK